jgi:hypothetical protein
MGRDGSPRTSALLNPCRQPDSRLHLRQRLHAIDARPAGISEADWLAPPTAIRVFILAQQQEIEMLRGQLTALASELSEVRERIGRSSRTSS